MPVTEIKENFEVRGKKMKHFKKRLKQRAKTKLGPEEFEFLRDQIKKNVYPIEVCLDDSRTVHKVEFNGENFYLCYDWENATPLTILPLSWMKRLQPFLKHNSLTMAERKEAMFRNAKIKRKPQKFDRYRYDPYDERYE